MTSKKQLKARIRARMAKTGESYTAARAHLVGPSSAVSDHGYTLRGGRNPDSSVIVNLLAHHGVSLSEPLAFGVGGGIGAGYILWEFKAHGTKVVVLGFCNQWQYGDRWFEKTGARLGLPVEIHRTGGAKGASARLGAELDAGRPCVIRPDRYHIGYWHLPAHLDGYGGHPVLAYRRDDSGVWIDDRNLAPLRIPGQALDAARARVSSYKNVLYLIEPASITEERLADAVQAGLRDCADHLSGSSDSFSLPAWRKWGRMMTDRRGAKAWANVFADGTGLTGALMSIWEGVSGLGMDGGHLRDLYADFLDEASTLLDRPELGGIAARFREIAEEWRALAEAALPADIPEFAELRELTSAVRASVVADGGSGQAEAAEAAARLWRLRGEYDHKPPLDDVDAVFTDLGTRILHIHQAETAAIAALRDAL
ncbi:BtrH N-terminal domain-containing protein [Rhizohabitans arisaemae]|uniref:BtrH N-terminal domain-containing protein n=1 Tax=Rhizohabitans arisaemae TaxID=2720610 RepID=UPI0024B0E076|nr:BtrH N-terminal domain-containing protein [Rhizohabitans arisaemae]